MRKSFVFISIIALNILFVFNSFAQEEITCKVLKSEIAKSYTGECKKGYAHGKGIAKGIDEYDGYFKKGIPHGLGKYTWQNGDVYEGNFKNGLQSGYGKYTWANGDVYEGAWLLGVKNGNGKLVTSKGITQAGKWYKDIYTGDAQATEAPYKILSKKNVRTIRISEKTNSATNNIEIAFKREGRTYHEMENLSLIGSSGTIINSTSYTAYESIIAPFKGKIMFTAPDDFYRSTYQCEFTFEITKQGSWLIEIVF